MSSRLNIYLSFILFWISTKNARVQKGITLTFAGSSVETGLKRFQDFESFEIKNIMHATEHTIYKITIVSLLSVGDVPRQR